MSNRAGFTLVELTLTLLIAAVLASMAAPRIAHTRDVLAVRAARDELVSLLATTRAAAVLRGGASLHIDTSAGTAWIEARDGTPIGDAQPIARRHGVQLEADRSSPFAIRYDGIGVGRMSNAVIRLRSGSVVGAVTVSAYGRVRT